MLAYNEPARAFFKWHPARGEYPNLVLFAIWDQRSDDQNANDEYGPLHSDSRFLIARY